MKLNYFLRDNRIFLSGLLGLVMLLSYYLIIWALVGNDPAKGTIMPLYTPPDGFSPAAMRYIAKMGYDHKAFAATIINMAVKRFLSIREEDGAYTLVRDKADEKVLTPEEKKVSSKLLGSIKEIDIKNINHEKINSAYRDLGNYLKMNFEKIYFITNKKYFFPGLILSFIVIAFSGFSESAEKGGIVIFMCIWLTIWNLGLTFLLLEVLRQWKEVISSRSKKLISLGGGGGGGW